MLHDVYLDAIRNREGKLKNISESNPVNNKILESARDLWIEHKPAANESSLAGVDSSYNRQQFQGFHLFAVDALCINRECSILAKETDSDIRPVDQNHLETTSMRMETSVSGKAASDVDFVLIDGSIISRFVAANPSVLRSLMELIKEHMNVVFISKTSDSREVFERMGSKVGDMYFFNRTSRKTGYSKPHVVTGYREPITVVYARLGDYTPLVKLELPGNVGEQEIENIIDKISYRSVAGYPYVLKLAHNAVVVSDNDIARLAGIYGLKNEIGAREVLR